MTAKCLYNTLSSIPGPESLQHVREYVRQESVHLVPGQEYRILAVTFRGGHPWYWIAEEENDDYLKPHWGGFFDRSEALLPTDWVLQWDPEHRGPATILPRTLAAVPHFFERLMEGDDAATAALRAEQAAERG